jgi:two-component system, LytTR family, response regulator LytT
MKKYKCLIVEDEPIAAEIIASFIERDKELELVQICSDAINAHSVLKHQAIDLMFLDLHLPILKGFDFLRKLTDPPAVIVTTAYHDYALEGYELDVVDYLLKPIPYERFDKAIQKFKHFLKAEEALFEHSERDYILVQLAKRQLKIYLDEIFFIESFREYIVIHTKNEDVKVKMPISKIESILDPKRFKRVHKSYIVSQDKIEVYSANELIINGNKIPVGRTYKEPENKNINFS